MPYTNKKGEPTGLRRNRNGLETVLTQEAERLILEHYKTKSINELRALTGVSYPKISGYLKAQGLTAYLPPPRPRRASHPWRAKNDELRDYSRKGLTDYRVNKFLNPLNNIQNG